MLRLGFISFLLFILSMDVEGQPVTNEAVRHYQDKELKKAKSLIDSAITLDSEKEDPYTWQVRGFIYKDLFKQSEAPKRSKYRKEAISAYKSALDRGAEGRVKKMSRKGLVYMAESSYNEAMRSLDTNEYERPIGLYERYVSLMKYLGRDRAELKKDMIQFYNRLGTIYMSICESNRDHDEEEFERTIDAFGKVLELDSSNYLANYNTGIMYYNRGVKIAQRIDPGNMDVELKKVKELQERSTKIFKKALPYMKEAHEQRPERIETLEGLSGIYYSLNEEEKSERYKKMKKELIEEGKR